MPNPLEQDFAKGGGRGGHTQKFILGPGGWEPLCGCYFAFAKMRQMKYFVPCVLWNQVSTEAQFSGGMRVGLLAPWFHPCTRVVRPRRFLRLVLKVERNAV